MNHPDKPAQSYFDKVPDQWDALYAHENRARYWFNRVFRPDLFERYGMTFALCGEISGAKVLDIGCGTGRYSIEFAKRGAAQVTGIDFAPAMINFAQEMATQCGVSDRCRFIRSGFNEFEAQDRFDIIIAMGLFDYVADPEPVLKKATGLLKGRFLASFPVDRGLWGLQRKIRYRLKNCPIYSYTPEKVMALGLAARFKAFNLKEMSTGIFLVASKGG
jgi:2-polyprenyl-3-methyl-5-hydroxy-6-metoxy-1,4-benzoquinol methylase